MARNSTRQLLEALGAKEQPSLSSMAEKVQKLRHGAYRMDRKCEERDKKAFERKKSGLLKEVLEAKAHPVVVCFVRDLSFPGGEWWKSGSDNSSSESEREIFNSSDVYQHVWPHLLKETELQKWLYAKNVVLWRRSESAAMNEKSMLVDVCFLEKPKFGEDQQKADYWLQFFQFLSEQNRSQPFRIFFPFDALLGQPSLRNLILCAFAFPVIMLLSASGEQRMAKELVDIAHSN